MKTEDFGLQKGFLYYDLRNTVSADWNYKEDDEELMKKLILNLLNSGNIVSCILRTNERNEIEVVDGNHRREAIIRVLDAVEKMESYSDCDIELFYAKKYLESGLDFTKVMCYYAGAITISEAKSISLKVNETRFNSNEDKLKTIIEELNYEFGDSIFEQIPFHKEDFFLVEPPIQFSKGTYSGEFEDEYSNQRSFKTIKLVVNDEIYEKWLEIQQHFQSMLGIDSSETIFAHLLENYETEE